MATIVDLLKTRRSVRAFGERDVPDAVLEDVLTAGRLSPSGGNEQPWRFGVVRERALIESVAAASYGQDWIAGAHMALAALERGIGSTWVSRFDVERIAGLLGLPDGCLPSELLVMGYPGASGVPREKKPTAEVVFLERWDDRKT